jgi:putative DNA primase/helicase
MSEAKRYSYDEITSAFPLVVKTNLPALSIHTTPSITAETISDALTFIDPDSDYINWIKVGMGIHAEFPNNEGSNIYRDWSANGKKYMPGEPERKWLTFGGHNGVKVSIGTVFWLAQQSGWKNNVHPYNATDIHHLIDSLATDDTASLDQLLVTIHQARLTSAQQSQILKKIKQKTGVGMTDLRSSLKELADNDGNTFHPSWASLTLELIGPDSIIFTQSQFYLWSEPTLGKWNKADDRTIKKSIHRAIEDSAGKKYRRSDVESVLDIFKTEVYRDHHKFNREPEVINVGNGELHLIQGTWILKPHERANYSTVQLHTSFDKQLGAPQFEKFLNDIFQGDPDINEKKTVVLEMMGYSLLSTSLYEKYIMLIGPGGNGKSVLLGVLEALLGRENVTAVQPSQFDNKFQRAHLDGKLVNIVTEIAEGAQMADAQLKAIVSGELTTAEHKNKTPFEFHPIATCWFGTNHLPHTRDYSDALLRRTIIVEFNNKFSGAKCDPKLKDKLVKELPGILNLALNAVSKVIDTREFTISQSCETAKQKWRLEVDQAALFIKECCISTPGGEVYFQTLWLHYKAWVTESGISKGLSKRGFTQRLERLGYFSERGTNGSKKKMGLEIAPRTIGIDSPPNIVSLKPHLADDL